MSVAFYRVNGDTLHPREVPCDSVIKPVLADFEGESVAVVSRADWVGGLYEFVEMTDLGHPRDDESGEPRGGIG